MINPIDNDISRSVVCDFRNGKIRGILKSFNDDFVVIHTNLGDQNFARSEVNWEELSSPAPVQHPPA
jgi:hypothetical protein